MEINEKQVNITSRRYKWDILLKRWLFYMDSYLGGEDYKYSDNQTYLIQGKTEKDRDFVKRLEYSAYINLCRPAISDLVRYIYSEPIVRKGLENVIPLINFGGAVDMFFRTCFVYWAVYGEVQAHYATDDPSFLENGFTLADMRNLKQDEYLINIVTVPPTYCPYFYRNQYMIYSPIDYELPYNQGIQYGNYLLNQNTYIWTDEELYVYKGGTKNETIKHNYGQTPFIRLYIDENKNNIGESFIKDIADLNRVMYNVLSSTSDEVINSAFSSLVLPWSQKLQKMYESVMATEELADGTRELIKEPQAFMVAPEGSFPQYLNRSIEGLEKKMEYMDFLSRQIKDISGRRISEMIERSGIAEAYQFQSYNAGLKFLATIMESYETLVFQTIIDYLGLDVKDWSIEYPKSFDLIDNIEKIKLIQELMDRQDIPTTAKKTAKRKFIKILLNPSDQIMDEINEEIENEEEVQEIMAEAPIQEDENIKEEEENEDDATI